MHSDDKLAAGSEAAWRRPGSTDGGACWQAGSRMLGSLEGCWYTTQSFVGGRASQDFATRLRWGSQGLGRVGKECRVSSVRAGRAVRRGMQIALGKCLRQIARLWGTGGTCVREATVQTQQTHWQHRRGRRAGVPPLAREVAMRRRRTAGARKGRQRRTRSADGRGGRQGRKGLVGNGQGGRAVRVYRVAAAEARR